MNKPVSIYQTTNGKGISAIQFFKTDENKNFWKRIIKTNMVLAAATIMMMVPQSDWKTAGHDDISRIGVQETYIAI